MLLRKPAGHNGRGVSTLRALPRVPAREEVLFGKFKLACTLVLALSTPSFAADAPGVTATEIKIGGVFPFSGPASSIGLVGKGVLAYVQSINERGGINGRKINYIAMDDAYSPPKAVEHVRKLVESDEVAFIFSQLGTPGNTASAKYLALKGVPTISIISGSNKFTSVPDFPLTTTGLVSFDTEGKIYVKYLSKALPNARYAILYQNDDLGKDYVNAFKAFLKSDFDKRVVTAAYEISDPTVDSQVGQSEKLWCGSAFGCRHAEIFSSGYSQGSRDWMEADAYRQFPVEFGVGNSQASRL
jgi:ABC-type branched-subunit amino acid transport system substrate-binding protein